MIILGLVLLLAAVIVGVVGVMDHTGSSHALTSDFTVFGYHVTGSTGTLFLTGIVVGAVGALGFAMLLAGAARARRARRELRHTRRDTTVAPDPAQPVTAPVDTGHRSWRHPMGGSSAGPTVAPH